jgi:hypothetical protein
VRRLLLRAGGALVLAAVLIGPSAQARAPHAPAPRTPSAQPAFGHTTSEWLMMGRNCGASISGT